MISLWLWKKNVLLVIGSANQTAQDSHDEYRLTEVDTEKRADQQHKTNHHDSSTEYCQERNELAHWPLYTQSKPFNGGRVLSETKESHATSKEQIKLSMKTASKGLKAWESGRWLNRGFRTLRRSSSQEGRLCPGKRLHRPRKALCERKGMVRTWSSGLSFENNLHTWLFASPMLCIGIQASSVRSQSSMILHVGGVPTGHRDNTPNRRNENHGKEAAFSKRRLSCMVALHEPAGFDFSLSIYRRDQEHSQCDL